MLKINRSRFEKQNMKNFTKEQVEIKRNENRSATSSWMDHNNMPERMYHIFNIYLERKSAIQDEIVFFDVGAAEGCFTFSVIKHFKNFKIIAFEPESERLDIFEENISLALEQEKSEGSVEVNQALVTDGSTDVETLRHYICHFTNGGAGSSRIHKADRPNRDYFDLSFDCIKLDDYVDAFNKVDVIKIDVEGAEILVLNGAKNFLEKHRPAIFLEIHSHPDNGAVSVKDVKEAMAEFDINYEFQLIEEHRAPMLSYYLLKPEGE